MRINKQDLIKAVSRRRRLVGFIAAGVVWAVTLVGFALPIWRDALRQAGEIEALENKLEQLNRWSVAGLWLARSVADRQPAVTAEFDRLFPAERDREGLFLELARVADATGVTSLVVKEPDRWDTWSETETQSMPATDDMMMDATADDAYAPPDLALQTYRVQATFVGDYQRAAGFLHELASVSRALNVQRVTAHPVLTGIEVELELDFYVHEPL